MGRFDELTQREKKPIQSIPFQERTIENTRKPASPQTDKPVSSQTVKPANPQASLLGNEQVEKYTTRLEPSLVKKIKLYAVENDINDYDVIRTAVKKLLAEEK